MKKRKNLFILFIGVFLLVLIGYNVWNVFYTPMNRYEENWSIVLSKELKQQYHLTSFGSLGDGSGYTIYKLKGKMPAFLKDASSSKDVSMEQEITNILNHLKVSSDHHPNFSHAYQYKILHLKSDPRDTLYIVIDKQESLVYFIENFM